MFFLKMVPGALAHVLYHIIYPCSMKSYFIVNLYRTRRLICFSPRYIPTKFKRRCETVDLNTRCDGARPVLREKSISFLLAFINVVGVCKANSRLLLRKIISTALPRTLRQYSKLNYHRVYSKAGEGVFCAVLFRGVMLLGKCS